MVVARPAAHHVVPRAAPEVVVTRLEVAHDATRTSDHHPVRAWCAAHLPGRSAVEAVEEEVEHLEAVDLPTVPDRPTVEVDLDLGAPGAWRWLQRQGVAARATECVDASRPGPRIH